MSAVQQLLASIGTAPLIVVDSADFDGTNDYMTRGAGLTGAADSKTGILSVWLRLDGGDSSTLRILQGVTTLAGGTTRFTLTRGATNVFQITAANAAGSSILILQTVATYVAAATWLHILASWNLGTVGARSIYINDVSDLSQITFTDDSIDYTLADWGIGARPDADSKFDGCMAELYFAPGQYLDFSIQANRRRFISSTGKPVSLGADGSAPTGTSPLSYQHLADAESVANFATNRGTGGNFTITGTLATGSTSPSD